MNYDASDRKRTLRIKYKFMGTFISDPHREGNNYVTALHNEESGTATADQGWHMHRARDVSFLPAPSVSRTAAAPGASLEMTTISGEGRGGDAHKS